MGFIGTPDQAPCRYGVIRHGLSLENGLDHVHIVVDLVREDGTKARTAGLPIELANGKIGHVGDYPFAQATCRVMEHQYGLYELEGAKMGRAQQGYSQADAERTRIEFALEGKPVDPLLLEQSRLRAAVMAAATAAKDEGEFVRMLRASGVVVRPWFAKGGRDEVTGYSVALRTPDGDLHFHRGSYLGKDMSLPRLRLLWTGVEGSTERGLTAWLGARREATSPGAVSPADVRAENRRLEALIVKLRDLDTSDVNAWVPIARRLGGAFAQLSQMMETTPGPYAQAAAQLAAATSTKIPEIAPPNIDLQIIANAALMTRLAIAGDDTRRQTLITARNLAHLFIAVRAFLVAHQQYRLAEAALTTAERNLFMANRRLEAATTPAGGAGEWERRAIDEPDVWDAQAQVPGAATSRGRVRQMEQETPEAAPQSTNEYAAQTAQYELAELQADPQPDDPAWVAQVAATTTRLAVTKLTPAQQDAYWVWARDLVINGYRRSDVSTTDLVAETFLQRAMDLYAVPQPGSGTTHTAPGVAQQTPGQTPAQVSMPAVVTPQPGRGQGVGR